MTHVTNQLACKKIHFYSHIDEELFIEWLKHVFCVSSFEIAHKELLINLNSKDLDKKNMHEIIILFYRYQINMEQLEPLVNEENKNGCTSWEKRYVLKKAPFNKDTTIILKPLIFYTKNDEDTFFNWLSKIPCVKKIVGVKTELHLDIAIEQVSHEDLNNLKGIFKRYNIDNYDQLKAIFQNTPNESGL